ncbi:MAG TPA: peptidase U32 [Eggerthellaceae bacterium]|nr:peptidase U32 [Eggerthellaceae bacterium]
MELLAPAGNAECLRAAVSAGADAVYLGLNEFNARRNADNFTVDAFGEACDYAHLRGVKIYVTLNVEILPNELDNAVELACKAHAAGADAFIVQDVGLAAKLGRVLPQAHLHISTQMNIHNAAGIELAARLGARRVTLARELSLAEIGELSALAGDFGMQVEVFAHGALCVCYSGQCLMSSLIGGRSANRGLCAQACRLPYELHREDMQGALPSEGEHLLSPRDLCTVDMLDQLQRAGAASLKVEGRMKSADYVHEVVGIYREVLDSRLPATDEHRSRLAEAFSRGFTTAYLTGNRGNDIMSYGRPNNRGVFVGRVVRTADGVAEVVAECDLHADDVLEFWTNRGHFTATLNGAGVAAGEVARIHVEQRTGKGDRVFRVRNAAAAYVDEPQAPRVPVRGRVELVLGRPARIMFEAGEGASYATGEARGPIVEQARTKAVSAQDVRSHVDRLGATPFVLDGAAAAEGLEVVLDDNVGIGFSQLHRLRAEALDALQEAMLAPYRERDEGCVLARASENKPNGLQPARECELVAWATNPGCARAAKRAGADFIYVPLLNFRRGQAQVAGVRQATAEQAGYPKQCVMAVPAVDHDPVDGTRELQARFDLWDYVREGKRVFVDSLAGAVRACAVGAFVEVGPHVPVTNAESLRVLADMGVRRVWLSPELTLGQIAELAAVSPVPLGLAVSGAQELMITEHCLLMSQGPCAQVCEACDRRSVAHKLVDRKGFDFPVYTDMFGRSHLYNGIELDAMAVLPDLLDIGISAIMVDTTLMDRKSASDAVGRALRARNLAMSEHRAVAKRPNTTTGHLFRGVS